MKSKTLARIYCIAFLMLSLTPLFLKAQSNIEFIENKGQWDSRVKYMGEIPGGAFYITSSGFTVLQHNPSDWAALQNKVHGGNADSASSNLKSKTGNNILRSHAYNVAFEGASPNMKAVPDKPLNTYNNYFIGNDPAKWASGCKVYQAVTLENVYPGIDVRYYTSSGKLKYDIIAKPGADISKIALKYDGTDKIEIKDKDLLVETSTGSIRELSPYTYQYENGARRKLSAKYKLKDNRLSFDIKGYDNNETLVIDPTLIFSSFSGSTSTNWGFTATYGPDGSFFGGGIVFGAGFPVSTGAYQTAFGNGKFDIGIIKLSPDGRNRLYATYIGGNGEDQPHSLIADGDGNLILAGRTSSSDYPVLSSQLPAGGYDIIVTKLNAAGTALMGSRRIGGTGDDGVNISVTRAANSLQQNYGDDGRSEVILDNSGNIYVASCTKSKDFPVTPGVFQSTFGGGNQDGVLLKFDPNLSNVLFASYLGGNGDDAAYVVSLAPNGDIYVGGGTKSDANFPGNKAGTINSTFQGNIDGFVTIVNNNGSAALKTSYFGTSGIDQVYGLKFDRKGFPYITGQTTGSWPVLNAPYSVSGAPQFICKLQPDLSAYVYSTTFGKTSSTPNISPTAFLVDVCENVYVSGWGGLLTNFSFTSSGTSGLPVTSDAIKSTTDGHDFYFFVLEKNAQSQLFGSFFGQNGGAFNDHVDGGTSRFDAQGVIYQAICANCGGGASFPVFPNNVWSTQNKALQNPDQLGCNLGMVKIELNFSGVDAGVQSSINGVPRDTAGCVPLTVDFKDTIAKGKTYYWNFGDGGLDTTKTATTSHTFFSIGLFNVMLIAEDSTKCIIRDTAYINIKVGANKALLGFNFQKLDPCEALNFRFFNTSAPSSGLLFSDTAFRWDFGDGTPPVINGLTTLDHSFAAPGTYIVKLTLRDTAFCNYQDMIVDTLRIAPNVVASFDAPAAGCVPEDVQFNNTSIAGRTFLWDFGDGATSTDVSPIHTYAIAGTYLIRLTANDPNTCNQTDDTTVTLTFFDKPVADFSFAPILPVENTPVTFTNNSSPDAVNFVWYFGDGDTLATSSRTPVSHQYTATGQYVACLKAINANGCEDDTCKQVEAIVVALVDVPNAFTPNSNDANSKIFVRGFGITKMRFIIWNRWGQKVFETATQSAGWDGKFKNVLQPMDVYAYTLDVEFFDGKKATKKGDITLIR